MQREYFCCGCGLFHWHNQYEKNQDTGRIDYKYYEGCPNDECVTHQEKDIPIFAVDTTAYFYFVESNKSLIDEIKWSSPRYATQEAIEFYINQGIPIKK